MRFLVYPSGGRAYEEVYADTFMIEEGVLAFYKGENPAQFVIAYSATGWDNMCLGDDLE